MLIFEGPDLSGKTTLVRRAKDLMHRRRWPRRFGWRDIGVWEHGPVSPCYDYVKRYMQAAASDLRLADRYALSELVYGPAYRGGVHPSVTSHLLRVCARRLGARGGATVLVRADEASVARRLAEAKDRRGVMGDLADYRQLSERYRGAVTNHPAVGQEGLPVLAQLDASDSEADVLDEAVGWVLDVWQRYLDRATTVRTMVPCGYGSLFPTLVLVGDRYPEPERPFNRPFDRATGASLFLTRLLDLAGIGERHLHYVNAWRHSGDVWLEGDHLEWLTPAKVVALGEEAHRRLEELGVDHAEFPHPQHLGRFHHAELLEWSERLRALCPHVRRAVA